MDLVFLVDDSSSILEAEWSRVQSFLISVVRRFNISREATRIGLLRYATQTTVIYRLTSTQTEFSVEFAIQNMGHYGGSKNLADALSIAYQYVFLPTLRPGASKVAVRPVESHSGARETIIAGPCRNLISYAPR